MFPVTEMSPYVGNLIGENYLLQHTSGLQYVGVGSRRLSQSYRPKDIGEQMKYSSDDLILNCVTVPLIYLINRPTRYHHPISQLAVTLTDSDEHRMPDPATRSRYAGDRPRSIILPSKHQDDVQILAQRFTLYDCIFEASYSALAGHHDQAHLVYGVCKPLHWRCPSPAGRACCAPSGRETAAMQPNDPRLTRVSVAMLCPQGPR